MSFMIQVYVLLELCKILSLGVSTRLGHLFMLKRHESIASFHYKNNLVGQFAFNNCLGVPADLIWKFLLTILPSLFHDKNSFVLFLNKTLPKIRTLKAQRPLCKASPFLSLTNLKESFGAGSILWEEIVSLLYPFLRNKNHPFNKAACSVSGDIIWNSEKECKTAGRVWNVCTWSSKSLKKLLRFWPRLVLLKTINVFSETQSNREWNNLPVNFSKL